MNLTLSSNINNINTVKMRTFKFVETTAPARTRF